jgi:hypothetical protein
MVFNMAKRETFLATLVVAFSALVGIGIVEVSYHIYRQAFPPKQWIMFFDGSDSIFRNLGHTFTYVPNSQISCRTVYFSRNSYSTEYFYEYKTNNFGLVQDRDLVRGVRSILLLGNSFTEGQGAEPWFELVAPQIEQSNYQPINGGLLGTGFLQWWELEQFLSANGISIGKLVVIFISHDLRRPKWNFSDNLLSCLRSISLCSGNEGFFRLPPEPELAHWVEKIRTAREPHNVSIKQWIGWALPATYAVYRFLLNVIHPPPQIELPQTDLVKMVESVINKLIEKYGRENVLFIQLPEKEELKGAILPDGLLTRKLIRDSGARYADGISLCGLDRSDFFVHDEHPNRQGYSKIAKCVTKVIEPFLTQDK